MVDVRCRNGLIVAIEPHLKQQVEESLVTANHAEIRPSLIDHHIHLLATAAARNSVKCGPPEVTDFGQLEQVVNSADGDGWIRGVGYYESVAGDLTNTVLDRICASRPLRIQHRSGRMWFLNTLALEQLGLNHNSDGTLFRQDELLRARQSLDSDIGDHLEALSAELASYGVTEVTDATPGNNVTTARFLREHTPYQSLQIMGDLTLTHGWHKIMLDESSLPEIENLISSIEAAHLDNRPVAIHCVTLTELVFTLSAIETAGVLSGDRIEHASVVNDETKQWIARLGVSVVTQPNFVYERGDSYREDVPIEDHCTLYNISGLVDAGIPLSGSTDAPFGDPNPWIGVQAASNRRTSSGWTLNRNECVDIEEALGLYTSDIFSNRIREIKVGAPADFMLLDRGWLDSQDIRSGDHVAMTFRAGEITYRRDQV